MAKLTPSGRPIMVPIAVGVVGLTLIVSGQVVLNRDAIQDDLTSRSDAALRSADLAGLRVSFSGRDATITGVGSPGQADRALAVVSDVDGVRVAEMIVAATPDATATADPSVAATEPAEPSTKTPAPAPAESTGTPKQDTFPVGFTLLDGTITVTGTVKSASDQKALVKAAEATGKDWTVVDRLTVDDKLSATVPAKKRFDAVTDLLAKAPIDGTKLVFQYQTTSVILRGTPATADLERTLLTSAAATVPKGSKVIDGLDVPAS